MDGLQLPLRVRIFSRANEGTVAAEVMIWLPFFLTLAIALADVFIVYARSANATVVFETATRAVATGHLDSCKMLEDELHMALRPHLPSATADCCIDKLDQGRVDVKLSLKSSEMGIGALSGFIDDFTLSSTLVSTPEFRNPGGDACV